MDQPRYLMVVNPAAGNRDADRIDEACAVLRAGGPVEVMRTEEPSAWSEAVAALETRVLVVAGGDGSIHAAARELRTGGRLADAKVGILPCGTGNDFARGVGIPLDPVEAAQVIRHGRTRRLDLLVSGDGGVAVNAVHAGLGAEAAERSRDVKDRLGPLAYPLGALIAAVRERGWALTVAVDGHALPVRQSLLMVGIANGPTIGGGTPLCPAADPGDGRLDVVAVSAVGAGERLAFGAALRDGSHLERGDVHHARGTTVTVHGEPVGFNADGELSGPLRSRTYRVDHHGWEVCVPR